MDALMTVTPMRVTDVYEDRSAVWQKIRDSGPYKLLGSLGGYEGFQLATSPWFRAHWALDGDELIDDVNWLLFNEKLEAASLSIFRAAVVRPVAVTVNLMGPMDSGEGAHIDTPMFRGLDRRTFPTWLLMVMGGSRLFERWYLHTSGAVSWFYDGRDGAYDYWPDGPGGEMSSEHGPFGNVAVVADNDHMYHRVGSIGEPRDYLPDGMLPPSALLEAGPQDSWVVTGDPTSALHAYPAGKVRVSILWKALVFPTEGEASEWEDHSDDLTAEQVVQVFRSDLQLRGSSVREPTNPFLDRDWQKTLVTIYGYNGRTA
jgi:hypothetical protein